MKKLQLFVWIVSVLGIALLFSCQKEKGIHDTAKLQTSLNDDSMNNLIKSFKAKCEMNLSDPKLKSGGSMLVDSAVFYIEAVLNYTYAIYDPPSNIVVFHSSIQVYPDPDGKLPDEEVTKLYQQVSDTVTAHYANLQWNDKEIVLVDLGYSVNHDQTFITIYTGIGNPTPGPSQSLDWLYGEMLGACYVGGYENTADAATRLQWTVHNIMWDDPPIGHFYYFTNVTLHQFYNPIEYPTGDPIDNYMDYYIYYASSFVNPLNDTVQCLSKNIEMPFYGRSYVNFCESLEVGGLKYKQCVFDGKNYGTFLKHELSIWVGQRWCDKID